MIWHSPHSEQLRAAEQVRHPNLTHNKAPTLFRKSVFRSFDVHSGAISMGHKGGCLEVGRLPVRSPATSVS